MNNKSFSWEDWAKYIESIISDQHQRITALEREIQLLKLELHDKKASPIFHVDKIEYHFDQLKVDTLEGSLQIGMSTTSVNQLPVHLEDLAYKENVPFITPTNEPVLKKAEAIKTTPIFNHLKEYLIKNGRTIILEQTESEPFQFSEAHIQTMIEDMLKQLPSRIKHYATTLQKENRELPAQDIISRTKEDILTAIKNHIQQSAAQWRDYSNEHQSE